MGEDYYLPSCSFLTNLLEMVSFHSSQGMLQDRPGLLAAGFVQRHLSEEICHATALSRLLNTLSGLPHLLEHLREFQYELPESLPSFLGRTATFRAVHLTQVRSNS